MNRRNTQQRRHGIVALINEQGEVQVDALSAQFTTSEVTIRKDLAELEKTVYCYGVMVVQLRCHLS